MTMSIRFVAEYYDTKTGDVAESKVLRTDKIKRPTTLKAFGYLHSEQIQLLQSLQDFKLGYETKLINEETTCPICGGDAFRRGTKKSNFHAVLTDHKIIIQRRTCQCGWSSSSTVEGIYGSSLHPDLVEKQVIQGSENSYRQASRQLNAESRNDRRINNDDRIRNSVSEVAKFIEEEKLKPCKSVKKSESTKELVAVIDGGHLKSTGHESRSFEGMTATVYNPDNLRRVDQHHNEITQKTSVASALSDHQKTIKQMILNACRREGSHASLTHITSLTDGASNCWSIANSLKPYCKKLTTVLDWFHITKRFTIIFNRVDADFKEKLEKVKWFLWHGNTKGGLERLSQLQASIEDGELLSALQELYEYIKRNQNYLTNYQERCLSK